MDAANVQITGPCPIDLDAIGYDRASKEAHCTHCVKSVHNLSAMTESDARTLLKANVGRKICVTYTRAADGQIRFTPPKPVAAAVVPLSRLRRSRPAAAAGLGLAAALAACTPVDNPDVIAHPPIEQTRNDKPDVAMAGGIEAQMEVDEFEGKIEVQPLGEIEVQDPVEPPGQIKVQDQVQDQVQEQGGVDVVDSVPFDGEMLVVDPDAVAAKPVKPQTVEPVVLGGEMMPVDLDAPCPDK